MKCNNCSFENPEGSSFCQECGSKLLAPEVVNETPVVEAPTENTPVIPVEVESAVNSNLEDVAAETVTDPVAETLAETVTNPVAETVAPTASVAEPIKNEVKKKKSKLPLVIVLVILVIALIGAAATFGKELFFKSDEDKLIEASTKTQLAKQKAVVGEIGFEEFMVDGVGVMEEAIIENLVKGLKLNYKLLSDADAIKVEGNLGVMMNGSELMNVTLHLNKEYLAIGVPALYKQVFYLNWEDIQSLMLKYELVSEDEMPDIDTERVIELIEAYAKALDYRSYDAYKDMDTAKYEELTYGYLTGSMVDVSKGTFEVEAAGEELSYDGQIYTFDIEMDEYMDLSSNLIEALLEDDNILPMITEGIDKVINTMIEEEDIYTYNMIKTANYEETAEEWDPAFEDELNDMKKDMLKEIQDTYDEAREEMELAFEDDEYTEMMDAIKDIYSEIDLESRTVVSNGYVMGSETFVTIDDSIVDAINDSPVLSDMAGYELSEFNELGILFKVKTYQRTAFMQIDEEIEFEGLPNNAINFADLDEMELFEIYQEIMINAEELSSGLMSGF